MSTAICFLSHHAWGADGLCRRCRRMCTHDVQVYDPGARSARCLDCAMPPPYSREYPPQPKSLTMARWIQDKLERIFGWESGPYS